MFREGDSAGVTTCTQGQQSTTYAPCNMPGCGQQGYQPCQHAASGTGSGGGGALTAASAMSDNWKINWIGVKN